MEFSIEFVCVYVIADLQKVLCQCRSCDIKYWDYEIVLLELVAIYVSVCCKMKVVASLSTYWALNQGYAM